jgi:hypothetical protein
MTAALRLTSRRIAGLQNFRETLDKPWGSENFRQKQKRFARIRSFGNGQDRSLKFRVRRELLRASEKPGVHLGVNGA